MEIDLKQKYYPTNISCPRVSPDSFKSPTFQAYPEALNCHLPGETSLVSFESSPTQTPQKYNEKYFEGLFSEQSEHQTEEKKSLANLNVKSLSKVSLMSDKRSKSEQYNPHPQNKLHQFSFGHGKLNKKNTTMEPLSANDMITWSQEHVKRISDNVFPDVVAETIDLSIDGSMFPSDKEYFEKKDSGNKHVDVPSLVRESHVRIELQLLKDQLKFFENELKSNKEKTFILEQENAYLTQEKEELKEHISFLKAKYEDQTSLETLRGHNLANARLLLKQIRTVLEEKEQKIMDQASTIQKLQKQSQAYQKSVETELSKLYAEIEKARSFSQSDHHKSQELQGLLHKQEQQIAEMNVQIEALKGDIIQKNSEIQKWTNSLFEKDRRLTLANGFLAEKDQEILEMQQHSDQLFEKLQEMDRSNFIKNEKLELLQKEITELKTVISRNEEKSLEFAKHKEEEIQHLKKEKSNLKDEVNRLKELLKVKEQELQKLLDKSKTESFIRIENHEEMSNEKQTLPKESPREVLSILAKVEMLKNELKKGKQKYNKLKEAISQKEKKLEEISAQLENKENQTGYNSRLPANDNSYELINFLEKEMKELKTEKISLNKVIENLEQKYEKSKHDIEEKDKEILYLKNLPNNGKSQDLKDLELKYANLKERFSQISQSLSQKVKELQTYSQLHKKLSEQNLNLKNEISDLKLKHQSSGVETNNQRYSPQLPQVPINSQGSPLSINEERSQIMSARNSARSSEVKTNIEKLLTSFSERENEFENIKHIFMEKMMSMNDKLSKSEQKCAQVIEENKSLKYQVQKYEKENSVLTEKIRSVETSMKLMSRKTSVAESVPDLSTYLDNKGGALSSYRKTHRTQYEDHDKSFEKNQSHSPMYSENIRKSVYMNTEPGDRDLSSAQNSLSYNILEMISPEMLSNAETISLILEMMRRVSQSNKLAIRLGKNSEFKKLAGNIRKLSTLEEQNQQRHSENKVKVGLTENII